MKRILVTGANGYLGRGIVHELSKHDVQIAAVDRSFDGTSWNDNVEEYPMNLFEEDDIFEKTGKPDVLLHLAWRDGFYHFSDAHLDDLPKHYKFIENMIDSGVKQVCVLGSMHEVGFYEGSIDENTPTNPLSLYGISKNALRQATMLAAKSKDIVFQWIRGFYIVGNTEYGNSVFSKITQAEKRGDKLFPFTMGMNQFDFIDYDIFCQQVVAVVMQQEVTGIINCCSGTPERIKERVSRFIEENGYSIKLDCGAFPDRPYDSKAVWGSTRKIDAIMSHSQKT